MCLFMRASMTRYLTPVFQQPVAAPAAPSPAHSAAAPTADQASKTGTLKKPGNGSHIFMIVACF